MDNPLPAKGDYRCIENRFEVFDGEKWLHVSDKERGAGVHHFGVSCDNTTIDYSTGRCSVCGAKWKTSSEGPGQYWERDYNG